MELASSIEPNFRHTHCSEAGPCEDREIGHACYEHLDGRQHCCEQVFSDVKVKPASEEQVIKRVRGILRYAPCCVTQAFRDAVAGHGDLVPHGRRLLAEELMMEMYKHMLNKARKAFAPTRTIDLTESSP